MCIKSGSGKQIDHSEGNVLCVGAITHLIKLIPRYNTLVDYFCGHSVSTHARKGSGVKQKHILSYTVIAISKLDFMGIYPMTIRHIFVEVDFVDKLYDNLYHCINVFMSKVGNNQWIT